MNILRITWTYLRTSSNHTVSHYINQKITSHRKIKWEQVESKLSSWFSMGNDKITDKSAINSFCQQVKKNLGLFPLYPTISAHARLNFRYCCCNELRKRQDILELAKMPDKWLQQKIPESISAETRCGNNTLVKWLVIYAQAHKQSMRDNRIQWIDEWNLPTMPGKTVVQRIWGFWKSWH